MVEMIEHVSNQSEPGHAGQRQVHGLLCLALLGVLAIGLAACGARPVAPGNDAPQVTSTATDDTRAELADPGTAGSAGAFGPVDRSADTSPPNATPAPAEDTLEYTPPPPREWPEDRNVVVEILWEELMPPGSMEAYAAEYEAHMASLFDLNSPIEEGGAGDAMVQLGTFETVAEIDGRRIRMPGYAVPFDFSANAEIKEFLLVPYFGACIHSPPPPPNQTIFVRLDKPIKLRDLSQAVWVEGTMRSASHFNTLGNAAYTLEADKMTPYQL